MIEKILKLLGLKLDDCDSISILPEKVEQLLDKFYELGDEDRKYFLEKSKFRKLRFCEVCKFDQDLWVCDDGHTRCFSCEYEKQRNENK